MEIQEKTGKIEVIEKKKKYRYYSANTYVFLRAFFWVAKFVVFALLKEGTKYGKKKGKRLRSKVPFNARSNVTS